MLSPRLVILPALASLVLLSGCATTVPAEEPSESATAAAEDCSGVEVVVEYGPLDAESVDACAEAGVATDVLAEAGVTTEGTEEYGDQIVCRVNGRPAADETVEVEGADPFTEPCEAMPVATAYWALWVRPSADAEWEYAQEGIATLELAAGESLGLVYTAGTDSVPPQS